MYLTEAVEAIREKLVRHRLSRRTTLWATILKEIAKQDAFDGQYADMMLKVMRSFLSLLDDGTIISLWKQTATGMGDETEDECRDPDSIRMDLEMELLQEITDLAWGEAKDAPRR
jgi:hypothetical protein